MLHCIWAYLENNLRGTCITTPSLKIEFNLVNKLILIQYLDNMFEIEKRCSKKWHFSCFWHYVKLVFQGNIRTMKLRTRIMVHVWVDVVCQFSFGTVCVVCQFSFGTVCVVTVLLAHHLNGSCLSLIWLDFKVDLCLNFLTKWFLHISRIPMAISLNFPKTHAITTCSRMVPNFYLFVVRLAYNVLYFVARSFSICTICRFYFSQQQSYITRQMKSQSFQNQNLL